MIHSSFNTSVLTMKFAKTIAVLSISLLLCHCAEFKDAGRSIGHGSRDAAKSVADGTKRVVNEITTDDPDGE